MEKSSKIIHDSLDTAESLERVRDEYIKKENTSQLHQTLSLYLVNFSMRYTFLLHSLLKVEDFKEVKTEILYKTYLNLQGDSRYLFELFIMTCHFLNLPKEKREVSCIALQLGELLHVHEQDKIIENLNSNEKTQVKLTSNQNKYKFLSNLVAPYASEVLPVNIDDCSPEIIKNRIGLKENYKNAKINYTNEWKTNGVVKSGLNSVNINFERIAQPIYALYSLNEHPSYYSLEKLNNFINLLSQQRLEKIEDEKFEVLSLVRPIAKAMREVCQRYIDEI